MEGPGPEGWEGRAGCGHCAVLVPTGKMEMYDESISQCWQGYQDVMDRIKEDWCDWATISR